MNINIIYIALTAAAMGSSHHELSARAEGAVKYTTNVVGSAIKSTAPQLSDDICKDLVVDKNTPIVLFNHCASLRPGWLKI